MLMWRACLLSVCLTGALGLGAAHADKFPDLGPRPEFTPTEMDSVLLGQLLFYDPILSGNRNISCATCHHPRFGTSDGVSLSLGEGGVGLGPERKIDPENVPEQRIPRNAPALWNLGATEFVSFFHDGRLEQDSTLPSGIRTPLGAEMTTGFKSALSAQAMFPVLSGDEMAGHYSENDVSKAVRMGMLSQEGGAWDIIAKRVAQIPEYAESFETIGVGGDIHFTDIANAIADFMVFEWRADNAPFDQAMRGGAAMSDLQMEGMGLFYGDANCASCHSGWLQTDHAFHAIGMPQIGPGKGARFESHARDEGRARVTGHEADRHAFRTPSLRNITLTGPYGHGGAYASLEDMVRHHFDPDGALETYDIESAILLDLPGTEDLKLQSDAVQRAEIAASNVLPNRSVTHEQIQALVAFLHALEDPIERLGVPRAVPSGLPVDQ